MKWQGNADIRGGGQFSGRLTAPLCFAGALALQLLEAKGIQVKAHICEIAGIRDDALDAVNPNLAAISQEGLAVVSSDAGKKMEESILNARKNCDSVGGIIECFVTGLPAGLGDPMFDGVENKLAQALFGIPGVKGVEFGAGFDAARMKGSEHNDPFCILDLYILL